MIIQNTSTQIMYLGFVNNGLELDPGEIYDIEEIHVENPTFQYMENEGLITILSYDPDFTRLAVREEVTGGGGTDPGVTITEETPFSFVNAPEVNVGVLTAGKRLKEVTVQIEVAFSPGTTISVGFSGTPNEIVPSTAVFPTVVNTYSYELNRLTTVPQLLKIFINGSPVTGEATLFVLETS